MVVLVVVLVLVLVLVARVELVLVLVPVVKVVLVLLIVSLVVVLVLVLVLEVKVQAMARRSSAQTVSLHGVPVAAVRGEPDQLQAVRTVGGRTSQELLIVVPHLRPLGLPLPRPGLRGVYGTRPAPLDHAPHETGLQVVRLRVVGNSG